MLQLVFDVRQVRLRFLFRLRADDDELLLLYAEERPEDVSDGDDGRLCRSSEGDERQEFDSLVLQ